MNIYPEKAERLFKLIQGVKELDGVGEYYRPTPGEVRPGDLIFLDPDKTIASGDMILAKSPKDHTATYYRAYPQGDAVKLTDPTDGEDNGTFPLKSLIVRGVVTGLFRDIRPISPMEFDEKEDAFLQKAEAALDSFGDGVIPRAWDINRSESETLYKLAHKSPMAAIMYAYSYGFLRGGRYEKASQKRDADKGKHQAAQQ